MNDKKENSGHYIKSYNNKDDHYDRSEKIHSDVKDDVIVSHEAHTYTNQRNNQPNSYNPSNTGPTRNRQQTTPPQPPRTFTKGPTRPRQQTPPTPPRTNQPKPTYASDNEQKKANPGCIVFLFCVSIYMLLRACS
jgi:hypothetical protein